MIHYQLRCGGGHEFEAWFRDSLSFDQQAERGLLSCAQCGTADVSRALMAPAVRTRKAAAPVTISDAADASKAPAAPAPTAALPDPLRATLQRLRAAIEAQCEDVGDGFADEARRIHKGDSPTRGIYGNATEHEREALADDGIEIAAIPWVKRADS